MRLFHRTSLHPEVILKEADAHFTALGLERVASGERDRQYKGSLGALHFWVKMEGGHYTFVEAHSDQVGESRLDKNVKRLFLRLHRIADPRHRPRAAY